jgi:hypothetical protein
MGPPIIAPMMQSLKKGWSFRKWLRKSAITMMPAITTSWDG